MHMADALISPVVGGSMMLATAGVTAYSLKNLKSDLTDYKVPLMGVMGAFIFSAQMINFTIPGTGSSGHIGGGLLLAILLGPELGFLTLAAILLIQALMFGDGGLLAYGCNVFNLGFYTCFIAYPLIYKRIVGQNPNEMKLFWGSFIAAIIGLQFGAFSVVLETFISGKTALSLSKFILLMQPIHLAIGAVEGVVTASIVLFLWRTRPDLIKKDQISSLNPKKALGVGLVVAILVGGMLSSFASENPDGLEWAIGKTFGEEIHQGTESIYAVLDSVQTKTAILSDYSVTVGTGTSYIVNLDTGIAGIIGVVFTFIIAALLGFTIRKIKKKKVMKGSQAFNE